MQENYLLLFALLGIGGLLVKTYSDKKAFAERERLRARERVRRSYGFG